jgi:hypothetical protein
MLTAPAAADVVRKLRRVGENDIADMIILLADMRALGLAAESTRQTSNKHDGAFVRSAHKAARVAAGAAGREKVVMRSQRGAEQMRGTIDRNRGTWQLR